MKEWAHDDDLYKLRLKHMQMLSYNKSRPELISVENEATAGLGKRPTNLESKGGTSNEKPKKRQKLKEGMSIDAETM